MKYKIWKQKLPFTIVVRKFISFLWIKCWNKIWLDLYLTFQIDLCPDFYPGYYYAQYFQLYGDDVYRLNISLQFGYQPMDLQTCIHDHNVNHDHSHGRTSAQYPNGGVFPITCEMRLWVRKNYVQGNRNCF